MIQNPDFTFEIDKGGMPSVEMTERAILSLMMQAPDRYVARAAAEGLDAECFYRTKPIHRAIVDFHGRYPAATEIDIIELVGRLETDGALTSCGGPAAIAEVYTTVPMPQLWHGYSQQLRECKARRMVLAASERIREAPTSEDAIDALKSSLEAVSKALAAPSRSVDWKTAAAEFVAQWKEDFESSDAIPGMATGYAEIDEISGGMRAGEFWIVCAKSTRGKSVMMFEIAATAIGRRETVAIFSLEMMRSVVVGRLISVLGSVQYEAITQPKKSNKHHRAGIHRGIQAGAEASVWIDDTPNQTMDDIEAECQRIKDITGRLDLIVIDYVQIVRGERNRGESREQEVARISMAAKQLAKKFAVPVISGSQLNAAGETRESRALEQDADALLFIADDGIKIGKMRNGKRDQVLKLFLHGDIQKFLTYPPNP